MAIRHGIKISLRLAGLFFVFAIFASLARAEFPVEDMGPRSLGLQYGLSFRGQDITAADVPSHEIIHMLSIAYSPLRYLEFEGGLGLDQFSVESYKQVSFHGDYGFSPSFGFALFTPSLFEDYLRISAGLHALYLNSEDSRGFRYSGFVMDPFASLIYSPAKYCDVSAGARIHSILGTMESPAGTSSFSNRYNYRPFASVTLKSPYEGAFLTLDVDMSSGIDGDWSHGPREAAVGLSFGAVIGWKGRTSGADTSVYFPAYPEMKEKQKKMMDELE